VGPTRGLPFLSCLRWLVSGFKWVGYLVRFPPDQTVLPSFPVACPCLLYFVGIALPGDPGTVFFGRLFPPTEHTGVRTTCRFYHFAARQSVSFLYFPSGVLHLPGVFPQKPPQQSSPALGVGTPSRSPSVTAVRPLFIFTRTPFMSSSSGLSNIWGGAQPGSRA